MHRDSKTVAAIDIGTNSVKLTVARQDEAGNVHILADKTVITRLGKGVAAGGALDPEAIQRTVKALKEFSEEAQRLGATIIAAVATSAVRDASNGAEFVTQAQEALHGTVEIISGDREAQLVYTAARRDPDLAPRISHASTLVTIDIGGGSTEIVIGQGETITFRDSLQLGAVRLTEKAGFSDPPTATELYRATQIAADALKIVPVPENKSLTVVASGGTIANLVAMERKEAQLELTIDANAIHAFPLTLEQIAKRLAHLAAVNLAERRTIPGLEPDRADVIVAGAIIQGSALRRLGVTECIASARGVRYGLLYELLSQANS